jgi:alpha-tubulin suppressor-like RCC1 family protein
MKSNVRIVFLALVLAALAVSPAEGWERFVDKGDGTVLDTQTNLMWLKDMDKFSGPIQVANTVISEMNSGRRKNFGHSDWRIPTVEELLSIIKSGNTYPALPDRHPFDGKEYGRYWTSTGGFLVAGYAWTVDIGTGVARFDLTSHCNFFGLWPARSAGKVKVGAFKPEGRPVTPGDVAFLSMGGGKALEASPSSVRGLESPVSVSASAVSSTEVMVSWVHRGAEAAWYNVYSGGKLLKSAPTSPLRVTGLAPDVSHCFHVTSYSAAGKESQKSANACVTTSSVKAKGTVWSMGMNNYGQLGNGSRNDSKLLVQVAKIKEAVSVAAGVEHAAAVLSDGSVWAWGRNDRGQIGDGTTMPRTRPVKVKNISTAKKVDLGWYHSLALLEDGSVRAWGRNYYGQLGNGRTVDASTPVIVLDIPGTVQVAAGWYHSLALLNDGTVRAWGWDHKGQLGNGKAKDSPKPRPVQGLADVKAASGGMYHSVALKNDGTVWAWGSNEYGQVGSEGGSGEQHVPVQVKGLDGVKDISAGMHFTLALKNDGTVWAWGRNDYGQLGTDKFPLSEKPVEVPGLKGIRAVAAGAHHAVAMDSVGVLWLWGWDHANETKFSPPRKVGGVRGITGASAGMHFTATLMGGWGK